MRIYVGYDDRYDHVYQVCRQSILDTTPGAEVIPIKKDHFPYDRRPGSTQFTYTRFLVPYLNDYKGWALFVDSDTLALDDLRPILASASPDRALCVVKHNYKPLSNTKMDNQKQLLYPRKNWSSVMLFNCSHPANTILSKKFVAYAEGGYLHQFKWLSDEQIGEFSKEYNWLVGWYKNKQHGTPKLLHYTEGGPWLDQYKECEFADKWLSVYQKINSNKHTH